MVVVEVNGYKIEPGANLTGVDLSGVLLGHADLSGANLAGVDLCYANPTGANLAGVDLRQADLQEIYHREMKANEDTIWPEGFDPVVARVIFTD